MKEKNHQKQAVEGLLCPLSHAYSHFVLLFPMPGILAKLPKKECSSKPSLFPCQPHQHFRSIFRSKDSGLHSSAFTSLNGTSCAFCLSFYLSAGALPCPVRGLTPSSLYSLVSGSRQNASAKRLHNDQPCLCLILIKLCLQTL